MMPAAKHGDPQLGVDIHLCVVPPSPSPVPLPTPHMSIVFDPMDYVPFIGATVTVCGMKRAVAGTAGIAIHIPPGFPFAPKLPDKDDEIFMGSATVDADGDPFSFLGVPVLACQVAGMPSPPRPKRKGGPRAMLLPTVFNLAIPTNVFIGGPPTISLMGMAFKFGLALLGKLAKSRFARALGQRFQAWRKAKFGHLNPGFLKCKILRAEPVNIVTGAVSVEQADFDLPGLIPVAWNRRYASDNKRRGAAGMGWETPADARLEFEPETGIVLFHHPEAPLAIFPSAPAAPGDAGAVMELMDGAMLSDQGDAFAVRTKEDRIYRFPKAQAAMAADGVREVPLGLVEDLCGNTLFYERDAQRRLVAIREWSGRRIEIDWSPGGFISRVSLHVPETGFRHVYVEYEQDRAGDLVAVRDALGNPYRFAYEAHHMVRHTDRNGLSFHYEFDRAPGGWRVVKSWGDGGLYAYRFEYLDAAMERRITDSLGHVSVVTLDERGLPVSEVDPLGGKTVFEYDEAGRTTAVVDPDGGRSELVFDERGNLLKLLRSDGSAVTYEVNDANKIVAVIDANGAAWRQEWDDRGLLCAQSSPNGGRTRYTYDLRGLPTSVTDPVGSRTVFAFDQFGSLGTLVDPTGASTRIERNELGAVLARTDAAGRTTRYRYDAKSRLVAVSLPGGGSVQCAYDAEDRLVRHCDEAGAVTGFEYFGIAMVARRHEPNGHAIRYHYNTEEQLVGITNQRGERFVFERDAIGRVVRETDFWGQSTRHEFSAAGHLRRSWDPLGRTRELATDPLGRILRRLVCRADGVVETEEVFEYDPAGNLVGCANEHLAITRAYDPEGRLIEERQGEFVLRNTFDAAGRRIRRETSAGNTVEYVRDRAGRVSAVKINDNAPIVMERNAAGDVIREILGEGLERRFTHDADSRLLKQEFRLGPHSIATTAYRYDPAGNLIGRREDEEAPDAYAYDAMGHLIEHRDPRGLVTRYLRDAAGDLLSTGMRPSRHAGSAAPADSAFSGVLRESRYAGASYGYDAAGNLIARSAGNGRGDVFEWDGNNRLIRSSVGDVTTSYGYDPLGRRIFKETNGQRTRFGWDGDALACDISPDDPASAPQASRTREFVYYPGGFVPLAMVRRSAAAEAAVAAAVTLHYHTDPNGCPIRLTDAKGAIVWSSRYSVLGRAEGISGDCENPLRLQGQYWDEETGLHYNRHRYYDPHIGAYISQDPIRTDASINLYGYGPNIFAWIDPAGLEVEWVDPKTLNFSQAYVTGETGDYETAMRNGEWNWNLHPEGHPKQSALTVIEIDGQLISMDNRRLLAAQNADVPRVPVTRVNPDAIKPGTNIIWRKSLEKRLNSAPKGSGLPKIQLPPTGTRNKPKVVPCK